MTGYLAIPIVGIAGAALVGLDRWVARRRGACPSRNPAVHHHLIYQPLSATIALGTVVLVRALVPESKSYLQVGALRAPVEGLSWMGVRPSDTWLSFGLTIGLTITVVTGIVVSLQAARTGSLDVRRLPLAILVALPFAVVNSAVEEAVFRLALCNALGTAARMMTVALISGVLFGVPHYFGHPGKMPGVLLAGFLGWLMCVSVLQTRGIAWAWAVHCAQDVVIFALLFAVAASGLDHDAEPHSEGPSVERSRSD